MSTKYCIANTAYWESIGYNPAHWRKSVDGIKALCHVEDYLVGSIERMLLYYRALSDRKINQLLTLK